MSEAKSQLFVFTVTITCYCYNSISLASSSEKSDMELSEEEERSSWKIFKWNFLFFHKNLYLFATTLIPQSFLSGVFLHVLSNFLLVLFRSAEFFFSTASCRKYQMTHLWRYIAAASPLRGSVGLGYVRSWGRKDSNILERSYNAVQAWLMTSKHTVPDTSSMLGWYT